MNKQLKKLAFIATKGEHFLFINFDFYFYSKQKVNKTVILSEPYQTARVQFCLARQLEVKNTSPSTSS